MRPLVLADADIRSIRSLLDEFARQYEAVEDPDFLKDCATYAQELPKSVRAFINDFRFSDPAWGTCIVSGHLVDDVRLGKTPEHWKAKPKPSPALVEEFLLVLLGTLLGDVFGWAVEQEGRIVHDVIPIKEHETKQMSTGSEQLIWWHTEEAFHPYSSDYIGLMCLRNHERVATTFGCLDASQLDEKHVSILFEPRFIIRPVESHLESQSRGHVEQGNGDNGASVIAYRNVEEMNERPQKISILYGDRKAPFIRIDPYFMDPLDTDPEAQQALNSLIQSIDSCIFDYVLKPGDICFVDNFKTVHGRKPFKAKYDGNDRWLKRVNVTRDLRKSRSSRRTASSRIIF
jgi:Fe(II)/alpha-ketoglutarate-dependent arginine beta-hydroxylase